MRCCDVQRSRLCYVVLIDGNRKRFFLQPTPQTLWTYLFAHVLLDFPPNVVRLRLLIAAKKIWNDPFKCRVPPNGSTVSVFADDPEEFISGSVENHLSRPRGKRC